MSTPHASTQLAIIVSAVRKVYSGRGDPPRSVTSTFYLFGLAKLPYDTYESLANGHCHCLNFDEEELGVQVGCPWSSYDAEHYICTCGPYTGL